MVLNGTILQNTYSLPCSTMLDYTCPGVFFGGWMRGWVGGSLGWWAQIDNRATPLLQLEIGTVIGNPMGFWKSDTPLDFPDHLGIHAPPCFPMGYENSHGCSESTLPWISHTSWEFKCNYVFISTIPKNGIFVG